MITIFIVFGLNRLGMFFFYSDLTYEGTIDIVIDIAIDSVLFYAGQLIHWKLNEKKVKMTTTFCIVFSNYQIQTKIGICLILFILVWCQISLATTYHFWDACMIKLVSCLLISTM